MTKKKVTSTYRREFSPERSATQPAVIRSFSANFSYRGYRRQAEHGHHKSPFVWDDWEYELAGQPLPDKPRKRTSRKSPEIALSSDSGSDCSECSSQSNHSSRGKHQPPRASGRRLSKSPASDDECNCGAGHVRRFQKQGQPVRFLSDTISKSLKKVSKRTAQPDLDPSRPRTAPIDDSPFVQYGMGDSEEETGNKRTHNVLSRQGVYPTAIGAKSRHNAAKQLRSSQPAKMVKSKTKLHDPQFDEKMNRQTQRWQSEYNKRYRQYPTCHYK